MDLNEKTLAWVAATVSMVKIRGLEFDWNNGVCLAVNTYYNGVR
jgi:hypothetical protein